MTMVKIPMVSPVSINTVKRYAVNSGVIIKNFDFSKITNAAGFLTYITEHPEDVLGATVGDTEINENRKVWNPEHNGLRMPFKGSNYFETCQPMLKASLVEMRATNLQLASGSAKLTIATTKMYENVQPYASYADEDYLENVTWFTNYGNNGIIGVTLKNALCISGMNWKIGDKGIASCDVEFRAHSGNALMNDQLPINYFIYYNSSLAGTDKGDEGETDEGTEGTGAGA